MSIVFKCLIKVQIISFFSLYWGMMGVGRLVKVLRVLKIGRFSLVHNKILQKLVSRRTINIFYLIAIRFYAFTLLITLVGACSPKEKILSDNGNNGIYHHIESFKSELVENRPVDIWLPNGYESNTKQRYSVMYLHDGQFMFDNASSPMNKGILMKFYALYAKLRYGTGLFWDLDKIATQLIEDERIDPVIFVSVWNLPGTKRRAEYMPQKMITKQIATQFLHRESDIRIDKITSDKYLGFLVRELKPYVDQKYRTKSDQKNTFIMGSSMGGMISAYAISEYPGIFGGAACLSTHWTLGGDAVTTWYEDHWPSAGNHLLYFDRGTESYDANYGRGQARMDSIMEENGFVKDLDWKTLVFEGESHTMTAWKNRVHIPLEFLLGQKKVNKPSLPL